MGYTPVLLEPYTKSGAVGRYWRRFHDRELEEMMEEGEEKPEIIMACPTYEKTLEKVKKYSPVLIIPGSDKGIEPATRLSHDLGLPGNPPECLPKMRNKYTAQEALKAAGVRCIESETVEEYGDALAFFKRMQKKGKAVVVKPVFGISSMGVYVCKTENELKKAFRENKFNRIYTMFNGGTGKVLIQECIDGIEYICNSVSSNGEHRIINAYKYKKRILPGKGKIYHYDLSLGNESPEAKLIAEYQLKVLDAIGVKYGPVHSEIMIDSDGPVLIEANCRICGANMKSSFLDEIFGVHDSRISLESYLDPDFSLKYKDLFIGKNERFSLIKFPAVKKSTYIKKLKISETFGRMPEYRYCVCRKNKGFFSETVNLSTSLCTLYFVCKTEEDREKLIETLADIEKNRPEEIYESVHIPVVCDIAGNFMA